MVHLPFKVWNVAWKVEDRYWKQTALLYKGNSLLFKTTSNPLEITHMVACLRFITTLDEIMWRQFGQNGMWHE